MKWKIRLLAFAISLGVLRANPLDSSIKTAGANAREIRAFLTDAERKHGPPGRKAAEFLLAGMPPADLQALKAKPLLENLDLAFQARDEFPWAREVPEEIFLNDVLPYAVFDEPRDPWRADLYEKCRKLVAGCRSATEAAQKINREFFNLVDVHYNTGRKSTNQSPSDSIAQGKATCTGLTILFVDACRSVGIPARGAGIAKWTTKEGNHTWPEVWDGKWAFTGADEYDEKGLNRGWFVDDAAQARADVRESAIYATSWRPTGEIFPMDWSPKAQTVAAINVTSRYTKAAIQAAAGVEIHLRLKAGDAATGDGRVVAEVALQDESGKVLSTGQTKAGRADWNDMPSFVVPPGQTYYWRVTRDGKTREQKLMASSSGTIDLTWENLSEIPAAVTAVEAWLAKPVATRGAAPTSPISRAEAERIRQMLWAERRETLRVERGAEVRERVLTRDDKVMRFKEKIFGEEPVGGHSLWISLHGGGGVPAEVNDSQWSNQVNLYQLKEGVCVAPRAPTNNWNLWHEPHMDPLLGRLIEDFIATRGVNPDKVYLVGYSAGGDGVYQLAPRMADRFAAAGMMAGHPNDSSPLSLLDLPFALLVGGDDAAYDRNRHAAEWSKMLDDLQRKNAPGYEHFVRIYKGLGHWMNRKDAEAIPWMAGFTRNPWPKRIVWEQGNVVSQRFYWLNLPNQTPKKGYRVYAEVRGQTIKITTNSTDHLTLRLSDELVDLDQPVVVEVNGKSVFSDRVSRSAATIAATLEERADPRAAATAELALSW